MSYIKKDPLAEKAKELQGNLFGAPMIVHAIEQAPTIDIEDILRLLEAEVNSSDKYIKEYDDSEIQIAYNQGLRQAYSIVKEFIDEIENPQERRDYKLDP